MNSQHPSVAFFGLARGGSSITCQLAAKAFATAGLTERDIGGALFGSGISLNQPGPDFDPDLSTHGMFYGPFREVPNWWDAEGGQEIRSIFVGRDLRDCLVSHYYAFKNFHKRFEEGKALDEMESGKEVDESIDEYVLEVAHHYKAIVGGYIAKAGAVRSYRYETIIGDLAGWFAALESDFHVDFDQDVIQGLVDTTTFVRSEADPMSHNRQGLPGDFHVQLQRETISQLNKLLEPEQKFLGYGI